MSNWLANQQASALGQYSVGSGANVWHGARMAQQASNHAKQAYQQSLAAAYLPPSPPRPTREQKLALLGQALSEAREKRTRKAWRLYMACFVAVVADLKPQLNTIQPAKRGFGGGSPKHGWAF